MYWGYVKAFLLSLIFQIILAVVVFLFAPLVFEIIFTISLILFGIMSVMLGIMYLKVVEGGWNDLVDVSLIDVQEIDIPMADRWNMAAWVLRPKATRDDGEKRPAVLIHHGLGSSHLKLLHLAVPLVLKGRIAVLPDARGHGESGKRFKAPKDDWYITEETGIFPDVHKIIDHMVSLPGVDPSRIAMIGGSLGGAACLTAGIMDDRVKIVIPLNPPYSFTTMLEAPRGRKPFTQEWFMKHGLRFLLDFGKISKLEETISPKLCFDRVGVDKVRKKVRLVHCTDDHLVLTEAGGELIRKHLDLPDNQCLFLAKGDHGSRGQETIIITRIVEWLEEIGL